MTEALIVALKLWLIFNEIVLILYLRRLHASDL